MFMRHLCEPDNEQAQATGTFADGVPREGLSRQQVLTRIGIMSLIRKKVQEFESINGLWSMPELKNEQESEEGQGTAQVKKEENGDGVEKMDTSADNAGQMETSITEMLAEATTKKDTDKKPDKQQPTSPSSARENTREKGEGNRDENKENAETYNFLTALKSTSKVSYVKETKPEKLKDKKFMVNMADGGFTELHSVWQTEHRAVQQGNEYEMWHRRHDYWLLSGIVAHGYSRWQDIQQDMRFAIISEPFNRDLKERGNFLEIKNKFLARRFKLLEQALVIEEQLRRASFLNINLNNQNQNIIIDPMSGGTTSVLALNNKFTELETLAESNYNLHNQAMNGHKPSNEVFKRVLIQLEDLLNDMKQEVNRLPLALNRVAPVTERLRMQERDILNKLTNNTSRSNDNDQATDQATNSEPYLRYGNTIGAFIPNLPTMAAKNTAPTS